MPRPDVVLISPYPSNGRHEGMSGVASYSASLARALSAEGAEVAVVAPADGDGDTWDGAMRVVRSFERGPLGLLQAVRAARDLDAPVAHLQHEMFLYGGPVSIPSLPFALSRLRGPRSACVVTAHQVVAPSSVDAEFTGMHRVRVPAPLARAGISAVQESIARFPAATIVHEPCFAEVMRGARVIPHGIERVMKPDRRGARQELGLDERFRVLCFGYLAPYKGLETTLEAARLAGPGVELIVAGGEHPRFAGVNGYARELRARYQDVARFTGYVPDEDVPRWFAAADVCLLPYPRPFSSSGALALALAHGTPPLLSPALGGATGAPRELIVPTQPDELGALLSTLALDGTRLEGPAAAAERLAEGRSWSNVARRHLELYEEVIADAERSSGRRLRVA